MKEKKMTLTSDAIVALQTVFLKCLVENENVQELLKNLEFEVVTEMEDNKYLRILNPPKAVTFDKQVLEEEEEQ